MSKGAVMVDVREPWEWAICQVAGSVFIPMREIPARANELPADKALLILCQRGVRSRHVMNYLRSLGRDDVANVSGGILAWADEVDPTLAKY